MRLFPLIIVVACVATPALTRTVEDDQRSVSVSLAGARFGNPQSVADLRRRIDRAVRQVCAPADWTQSQQMQARNCRAGAQRASERQLARYVDRNRLAALMPK